MNKRWIDALAAGMAVALLAAPAFAPAAPKVLESGAAAPDFTAPASLAGHDFTFSLRQALAKGPVVLYFFPAAFTQGCDLEAHTFSTHAAQFTHAGATIIGVSEDSLDRLDKFSSSPDYCAGKFPVASDPSGDIGILYGVDISPPEKGAMDVLHQQVTHGYFARTTVVIDRDGKIAATMSTASDHITPIQHVTRSLAIVQLMQAH